MSYSLSTFNLKDFHEASDPLAAWMFYVEMEFNDGTSSSSVSFVPTKTSLPNMESITTTKKFFGSEKTFAIMNNYSGELEMEFYLRSVKEDNAFYNFLSKNQDLTENRYKIKFPTLNYLKIILKNRNYKDLITYNIKNPVITKVNTVGEGDYSSDSALKFSVTFHYDYWTVDR